MSNINHRRSNGKKSRKGSDHNDSFRNAARQAREQKRFSSDHDDVYDQSSYEPFNVNEDD